MISIGRTTRICCTCVAMLITAASLSYSQTLAKGKLQVAALDENTGVRFFYQPVDADYFHVPLVIHAVDPHDSRLNTAPMAAEGRVAYVSISDMRELLQALSQSKLSWQQSEKVEVFGSFKKLPITDTMEITVLSSKGTSQASLDSKNICETLQPIDSNLKAARAVWEFQRFRLNYRCSVPNFGFDSYPDHY
jgi:hypothetical protein